MVLIYYSKVSQQFQNISLISFERKLLKIFSNQTARIRVKFFARSYCVFQRSIGILRNKSWKMIQGSDQSSSICQRRNAQLQKFGIIVDVLFEQRFDLISGVFYVPKLFAFKVFICEDKFTHFSYNLLNLNCSQQNYHSYQDYFMIHMLFQQQMECPCSNTEITDLGVRSKYQSKQQNQEDLTFQQKQALPFKIRAIKFLGLDQYMINKFLFNPRHKYRYRITNNSLQLIQSYIDSTTNLPPDHQHIKKLQYQTYKPPKNYQLETQIIQNGQISVPVAYFKPINSKNQPIKKKSGKQSPIIIYSHGNSSDLYDSVKFLQRIIGRWQFYLRIKHQNQLQYQEIRDKYALDFLTYDYTGYGVSSKIQDPNYRCSQRTICSDLQSVINWVNRQQKRTIILWGFSLGSVPTVNAATMHNIYGCIMQSPFASITNALKQPAHMDTIPYQGDLFSNIDKISEIRAEKILIMHGDADQIVSATHSQILYDRYVKVKTARLKNQFLAIKNKQKLLVPSQNKDDYKNTQWEEFVKQTIQKSSQQVAYQKLQKMIKQKISFIKIAKLSHNGIHSYLFSKYPNELQRYFFGFIQSCCKQIITFQPQNAKHILSHKLDQQKQFQKISKINQKLGREELSLFQILQKNGDQIRQDQNLQRIISQHGDKNYLEVSKLKHERQRFNGRMNEFLIQFQNQQNEDDDPIQACEKQTQPTQESHFSKSEMFHKNRMLRYF